jgi:hypothetical protein
MSCLSSEFDEFRWFLGACSPVPMYCRRVQKALSAENPPMLQVHNAHAMHINNLYVDCGRAPPAARSFVTEREQVRDPFHANRGPFWDKSHRVRRTATRMHFLEAKISFGLATVTISNVSGSGGCPQQMDIGLKLYLVSNWMGKSAYSSKRLASAAKCFRKN